MEWTDRRWMNRVGLYWASYHGNCGSKMDRCVIVSRKIFRGSLTTKRVPTAYTYFIKLELIADFLHEYGKLWKMEDSSTTFYFCVIKSNLILRNTILFYCFVIKCNILIVEFCWLLTRVPLPEGTCMIKIVVDHQYFVVVSYELTRKVSPIFIFNTVIQGLAGSQAWVRRFESLLDSQAGWPGRYMNVRRCGGLPMGLLQHKDPLELFSKSREFVPGSGFSTRRDMT